MTDDRQKINNEPLIKQVSEAIKQHPSNWREGLADLGFEWEDDSIKEEVDLSPSNPTQQRIVDYFEGRIPIREILIEQFVQEVERSDRPLFTSYFQQGNKQLLQLLLNGLELHPTNDLLLSGLSYFHEHSPILSQLIQPYLNSCLAEDNLGNLKATCIDFILTTEPDGYAAVAALQECFQGTIGKLQALKSAISELSGNDETISF
ncbi:MAG: hypothetical protein HOE44_06325 [Candidatus Marinimicrobia bacterium]|nr:hypothetical protein [Candidatus Neomarinimicrobiota bacterium]